MSASTARFLRASHAPFLAEAQYLAGLPDRLDRLDPRLPEQLAAGFGKHPWVKSVTSVRVRPPDPVIVQLTFRVPALVVGETVLDGDGVVLPRGASTQAIPRLTQPESPGRPAGQPHADPFAVASARVAALVQPHQGQLQLWAWERTDDGLILANESRRVLWGVPGNDDAAKLRRVVAGAGDVH